MTSLQDRLDRLPAELINKIFSYFAPEELCLSIAPVCKKWHQMVYNTIVWQPLYFNGNNIQTEKVLQILGRTFCVQKLGLKKYEECWKFMFPIINCPFLRSLHLSWCSGINWCVILPLRIHCPLLEELNLEGCKTIDYSAIYQIVQLKKLKKLNLSHCKLIKDNSIVLIANECSHLQELNIDEIEFIYNSSVLTLIEKRKSNLKKLYLDGWYLTDISYEALEHCSNLTDLSVSYALHMLDHGLVAIKNLKFLQHLTIRNGRDLTKASLIKTFQGPNLQNLKRLDLHSCYYFNDEAVEEMTKCCPSLKDLTLDFCFEITDKGLHSIIFGCKYLEVLSLAGLRNITGVCFTHIPICLPKLVSLKLENCPRMDVQKELLNNIVNNKPDLQISTSTFGSIFLEKDSVPVICQFNPECPLCEQKST
uniref:F-box domain-containing protein n=1 Tax=Strigamia maritima TaxID=126957 RepID=T1IUI0_STRMM